METGNYILTSDLTVEAYLWGVRVKSIQYRVTERLDQEKSLISQNFKNEDGSYFLINYNDATDGSKFLD